MSAPVEYVIRRPDDRLVGRAVDRRLDELEELAEQFWPGKDDDARALRCRMVWHQFEAEIDWDNVEETEPLRERCEFNEYDIAEMCTVHLQPALGIESEGYGDNLRAELKRQGRTLEELELSLKRVRENIPWEEFQPQPHPKTRKQKTFEEHQNPIRYPWKR